MHLNTHFPVVGIIIGCYRNVRGRTDARGRPFKVLPSPGSSLVLSASGSVTKRKDSRSKILLPCAGGAVLGFSDMMD